MCVCVCVFVYVDVMFAGIEEDGLRTINVFVEHKAYYICSSIASVWLNQTGGPSALMFKLYGIGSYGYTIYVSEEACGMFYSYITYVNERACVCVCLCE